MSYSRKPRLIWAVPALALLAGCDRPFDYDLRGNFGDAFHTADAARQATGHRPRPDDRGVLSYPNYQVAVAKRGDTVADVAGRIGMNASELASYNGLSPNDPLRKDEVLALPGRVSESAGGPIQPPSDVDIAAIAGSAIDKAEPARVETTALAPAATAAPAAAQKKPAADSKPNAQVGIEPVRHKVVRGETAYTISRLYKVSVRSLAEWNGLGPEFTIREGQYLLIPVPDAENLQKADKTASATAEKTTVPGEGSPTPTPPSASKPLPAEKTIPAAQPAEKPKTPDLGKTQTKKTTSSRMDMPVNGSIIREYKKGKTDGIDISAASGTPVKAAADGSVAAITSDGDKVPIVVVKHADGLLTVYANVDGIRVEKGDSVTRGQTIAKIRDGKSNYVHFEVRKGFDSIDPMPYLN